MNDKVRMVRYTPLKLSAKYGDGEKFASLLWASRMSYPRITVFLDNDGFNKDKVDYTKQIRATFDHIKLNVFLTAAEKIIAGDSNKEIGVKCFNHMYSDGQKLDKLVLQSTVYVGKDEDGIVYIKLVETGKPEVKFYITMDNKYVRLVKSDGQDLEDEGIRSKLYATEYFKTLKSLLDHEIKQHSKITSLDAPGGKGSNNAGYKNYNKNANTPVKNTPELDQAADLVLEDL